MYGLSVSLFLQELVEAEAGRSWVLSDRLIRGQWPSVLGVVHCVAKMWFLDEGCHALGYRGSYFCLKKQCVVFCHRVTNSQSEGFIGSMQV